MKESGDSLAFVINPRASLEPRSQGPREDWSWEPVQMPRAVGSPGEQEPGLPARGWKWHHLLSAGDLFF